jgi:hypothetical protein
MAEEEEDVVAVAVEKNPGMAIINHHGGETKIKTQVITTTTTAKKTNQLRAPIIATITLALA